MARYVADQNKVIAFFESGTYASIKDSGSPFWIGQVIENAITDSEGKVKETHIGTTTRSFNTIDQGPRDVTGTITYKAQDMRIPFWTIGSVQDSAANVHIATEVGTDVRQNAFTSGTLNPSWSFTAEDSKQAVGTGRNFIRTVNGCIPNITTITMTQGEKVNVDVDYVGQTLAFASGTTGSVAEDTTTPYLWSHVTVTVAGSPLSTIREAVFAINQNLDPPHYLNGSRDISIPILGEREYTLDLTMDLDGQEAEFLYNDFYKSNEEFNAIVDLNADTTAGSQHTVFTLSGCKIMTMEVPSPNEGVTESTISIAPKSVVGSAWDQTVEYNPF